METKWTKGEWKHSVLYNVDSENHPICDVVRGDWGDSFPTLKAIGGSIEGKFQAVVEIMPYGNIDIEEAKANAQLISAAPNLYEACEWAIEVVTDKTVYEKLLTALNKAKGI